ncbi:MAG: hypothetical protein ACRDNP_08715 [Gaiellaceae bacterium]
MGAALDALGRTRPSFETTVLSWRPSDRIPIRPGRTLQVVRVRDNDADQAPVLVVQDVA